MTRTRRWILWVLGIAYVLWVTLWLVLREPRVKVTTYEVLTPNEGRVTARIVQRALQAIRDESKPDHLTKRDAHAKPHGCVTARLTVREDIAQALRYGVFARPGHSYPAWVRFSNGTKAVDNTPDARGMAIKLMEVPGAKLLADERDAQTQDFLMISASTFFVKDVDEYEPFFDAQADGHQFRYFLGWNPLEWRLRELHLAGQAILKQVPSPLATDYFSMLPFKLGPHNIKYTAAPCKDLDVPMPEQPGPQYLRAALVDALRPDARLEFETPPRPAACFALRVQLQNPERNMPIEDATIEWKEADSPFVTVATLEIPHQEFSTDEQNKFCEALSFTPWHALPEHRPLGSLNRSRHIAYEAVSRSRHERNRTPRYEPLGFCLKLDGKPCPTATNEGAR